MNILIISHFFNIDGIMGSVRWTQLAMRLAENHHVTVVANEKTCNAEDFPESRIRLITLDNECYYVSRKRHKKVSGQTKTNISSERKPNTNYVKDFIRLFLYMTSMKLRAKKNAHVILDLVKDEKFDLVITTSRPFIDCFLGYEIVRRLKCKWILDQRDLPYSDEATWIELAFYREAMRRMDKKVDVYTIVSKGMRDDFISFSSMLNAEKVTVLHNGFTESDRISLDGKSDGKLKISCVGDLYAGRRDADLLFAAIDSGIEMKWFSEGDIEIEYAGDCGDSLFRNAEKYSLCGIIHDHGRVLHAEAMKLMNRSQMLLLLTWNTSIMHGVLPGKMYEYMLAEKPVICITSGDKEHGEAGMMIDELGLGISVDYIHYEEDTKRLAKYLRDQVKEYKCHGTVTYTPNSELVQEFNYDNLCCKLEKIIDGIFEK